MFAWTQQHVLAESMKSEIADRKCWCANVIRNLRPDVEQYWDLSQQMKEAVHQLMMAEENAAWRRTTTYG